MSGRVVMGGIGKDKVIGLEAQGSEFLLTLASNRGSGDESSPSNTCGNISGITRVYSAL